MLIDLASAVIAWLFVIAPAGTASQQPARDRPQHLTKGDGVISGRVTDKSTGRPIRGAVVTLSPEGNVESLESRTDGDGRYEFRNLPPGRYGIGAGPGELRTTHLMQVFGEPEARQYLPQRLHPAIALTSSETRADVDLGLVRTLAIAGHVFDESGGPMTGIRVFATRPDGTPVSSRGSASDDRGEYRVFGLQSGRYRVCALVEGSIEAPAEIPDAIRTVKTCHPSARSESEGADVALDGADATSIDIRMRREGAYTLSGTILDNTGAPVSGAFVNVRPVEDPYGGSWPHDTSRSGRFELRGLTPGRYLVSAFVGGPEFPGDRRPVTRDKEAGFQLIEMPAGDLDNVLVALSKGVTVRGRFVFEGGPPSSTNGIVVHLGQPFREHRLMPEGPLPPTAVGADLTFRLDQVFRYPRVFTVARLPEGWAVKSVRHGGRDITDLPVEFGPDASSQSIEVIVTSRTARLDATVLDEEGRLAPETTALLISADPERRTNAYPRSPDQQSDTGEVTFSAVLPGTYLVAALKMSDYFAVLSDPPRIEALATVAERVTLEAGERKTIVLRRRPLPEKQP